MISPDPDPARRLLPALALFPLRQVLFPGGQLALKVFEARHLDLVADCLRRRAPFGVVCLTRGGEVRGGRDDVRFAGAGVLARIDTADAEQPGLLHLACTGTGRFRLVGEAVQQADGLWVGDAQALPDDEAVPPDPALRPAVQALAQAIEQLRSQGHEPFALPHRLDEAGWVANRWCELLPVPQAAKQRLMELDDPQLRLRLVHDYLAGQGVLP